MTHELRREAMRIDDGASTAYGFSAEADRDNSDIMSEESAPSFSSFCLKVPVVNIFYRMLQGSGKAPAFSHVYNLHGTFGIVLTLLLTFALDLGANPSFEELSASDARYSRNGSYSRFWDENSYGWAKFERPSTTLAVLVLVTSMTLLGGIIVTVIAIMDMAFTSNMLETAHETKQVVHEQHLAKWWSQHKFFVLFEFIFVVTGVVFTFYCQVITVWIKYPNPRISNDACTDSEFSSYSCDGQYLANPFSASYMLRFAFYAFLALSFGFWSVCLCTRAHHTASE
eukprot:m.378858 g.378858  ORF g.378858 m.378858 type:complete len:284 (-) comp95852_c0_seq1:51-902(-)